MDNIRTGGRGVPRSAFPLPSLRRWRRAETLTSTHTKTKAHSGGFAINADYGRRNAHCGSGKPPEPLLSVASDGVVMRDLNYALKLLCQRNRDGSYATQADREHILALIATQLEEMGFRHMNAHSLKPKHVARLVERWLAERLAPGTIKNRMSALRWWAQKVGKENVVARTNKAYAIADRVYVTNVSKARDLDAGHLGRLEEFGIRVSLRLQAAFGLRREESIKIIPSWADRGDWLVLKDSWTKGGRPRQIPIRNEAQRQLLEDAKAAAQGKSLIAPGYATYRAYREHFRYQCDRVGIHAFHGHRHGYAQARYEELTGWMCPARGGPKSRELSPEQRAVDLNARLTISRELGHNRERITAVYLGR